MCVCIICMFTFFLLFWGLQTEFASNALCVLGASDALCALCAPTRHILCRILRSFQRVLISCPTTLQSKVMGKFPILRPNPWITQKQPPACSKTYTWAFSLPQPEFPLLRNFTVVQLRLNFSLGTQFPNWGPILGFLHDTGNHLHRVERAQKPLCEHFCIPNPNFQCWEILLVPNWGPISHLVPNFPTEAQS